MSKFIFTQDTRQCFTDKREYRSGPDYAIGTTNDTPVTTSKPLPGVQLTGARASPLTGLANAVASEANHRALNNAF